MRYRSMGKLDWKVSALGFGGMRLPVDGSNRQIDYDKAGEMISKAIEHGINYFDTAWTYHQGESEIFYGKLLQGDARDKVRIATKSPVWLVESVAGFHSVFDTQRTRLDTDHIDVYLFHALNEKRWGKVKKIGLLDEMLKLKAENKISHIGFSYHGSEILFREIIDAFDWDIAQIQYNYLDTEFQATVRGLDYAAEKNIAVVIMEPLRGGKLAESDARIEKLLGQADRRRSLVEWALHFVLDHPGVSTVLSGMNSLEQLEQNLAYIDSFEAKLSTADLQTVSALRSEYERRIKVPCTSCQYCMPCPEGIDIPENLFLLNQAFWIGKAEGWIKKWYEEMESDDPSTFWHGKGAASRCTACGECLEKCPQNIAIPDELAEARKVFED